MSHADVDADRFTCGACTIAVHIDHIQRDALSLATIHFFSTYYAIIELHYWTTPLSSLLFSRQKMFVTPVPCIPFSSAFPSLLNNSTFCGSVMLPSLRKAARSLETSFHSAFSTPASTAFTGTTLTIAGITVKLGQVFAEGGYSFIHIATPVSSDVSKYTRYAVKRLPYSNSDEQQTAAVELNILEQIPHHPNIVRYYGSQIKSQCLFLMFELADGGSLQEILTINPPQSPPQCLNIFIGILSAIVHLHAQPTPISFRDVKLENILYDRLHNSYKLCDFGSCTTKTLHPNTRKDILQMEDDISNNCTAMYRAPELVDLYEKMFICEKTDVWALGCVWHAILYGTLPFAGDSTLQISRGFSGLPDFPEYPIEFGDLLKGMLTIDPAERLDSFAVLHTVLSLENRAMDPQLAQIGERLREKRQTDFGQPALQLSLPSSSAPAILFNTNPMESVNNKPDAGISAACSVPSFSHDENAEEQWADFDSAFGPATKATNQQPQYVQSVSQPAPASQYSGAQVTVVKKKDEDLLINFGVVEASNTSKAQSKMQAASRHMDAGTEGTDLIDFG